MYTLQAGFALVGSALLLSGCMVNETKPLPKVEAVQAQVQIPEDELLDVGVRDFDSSIPEDIAKDDRSARQEAHLSRHPQGRVALSSRRMLRGTLESSGQWGAVRVVPSNVEFVDVIVSGKILDSTGAHLALEVSVADSTGRVWITKKRYESIADLGSYKTDASLKQRDPFQNVYSQIANDMVAARDKLLAEDRRDIRRVTELRFAQRPRARCDAGLPGEGREGHDEGRAPAGEGRPATPRASTASASAMAASSTRSTATTPISPIRCATPTAAGAASSFEEIEKETRARNKARTRTFLGAAAVLASVFVPGQCPSHDYNCRRIENAARTAGAIGGTAAVLSGLKKYSDARVHAQALKELSRDLPGRSAPQVVDVEGRTLRLTGTAEEQYREWRELLQPALSRRDGRHADAGDQRRPRPHAEHGTPASAGPVAARTPLENPREAMTEALAANHGRPLSPLHPAREARRRRSGRGLARAR